MKKSIITIAIALSSFAGYAGVKTDTTKTKPVKEAHKPKTYAGIPNNTMITINITLPAGLWGSYSTVSQVGPDAIDNSDRISAVQAKNLKLGYKTVLDSLNSRLNAYLQADMQRWAADTLKEWNKIHHNK